MIFNMYKNILKQFQESPQEALQFLHPMHPLVFSSSSRAGARKRSARARELGLEKDRLELEGWGWKKIGSRFGAGAEKRSARARLETETVFSSSSRFGAGAGKSSARNLELSFFKKSSARLENSKLFSSPSHLCSSHITSTKLK